jgi:ketosteroid isomerase-like protein
MGIFEHALAAPTDWAAVDRNQALVRRFLTSGDLGLWAADARAHVAGRNPLSGTRVGREAIADVFGALLELTDGTFGGHIDSLVGDGRSVVALATVRAHRGPHRLVDRWVLVFAIDDGLIEEAWVFATDQATEDRFWSPRARWPGRS